MFHPSIISDSKFQAHSDTGLSRGDASRKGVFEKYALLCGRALGQGAPNSSREVTAGWQIMTAAVPDMAEFIGRKEFLKYCQSQFLYWRQSAICSVTFLWPLWRLRTNQVLHIFSSPPLVPLTPPPWTSCPTSSFPANSEANYSVTLGAKPTLSALCLLITATCLMRSLFFPCSLYNCQKYFCYCSSFLCKVELFSASSNMYFFLDNLKGFSSFKTPDFLVIKPFVAPNILLNLTLQSVGLGTLLYKPFSPAWTSESA